MDKMEEKGYLKLSQWKREVKQHCQSGLKSLEDIISKACQNDIEKFDLGQVQHEFFEILEHLK